MDIERDNNEESSHSNRRLNYSSVVSGNVNLDSSANMGSEIR
jgi:hypothetical protein